jgi:hypothetical protein
MNAPLGSQSASKALFSVGCPACGVKVVSASLSVPRLLDRHLRYCSWEPSSEG